MQDEPYEEVPDWLREMRGPLGEQEGEEPEVPMMAPFEPRPSPSLGSEPLLEDLREQALESDLASLEEPPREGLAGMLQGLAPWQRFILALLLFLDVALLGCMCLVMTGRVVPFQ